MTISIVKDAEKARYAQRLTDAARTLRAKMTRAGIPGVRTYGTMIRGLLAYEQHGIKVSVGQVWETETFNKKMQRAASTKKWQQEYNWVYPTVIVMRVGYDVMALSSSKWQAVECDAWLKQATDIAVGLGLQVSKSDGGSVELGI